MNDIYGFLQVKAVGKLEHFPFNFLHFYFFINGEGKNPFLRALYVCLQSTVVHYILIMEVILFRRKRCFVKLRNQVVGIFVLHEKPEAMYISNLAVAQQYRRLGIATYILNYANKQATQLDKKWLELSVLKANIPALRLYRKLGFTKKKEKKWSFIMLKKSKYY